MCLQILYIWYLIYIYKHMIWHEIIYNVCNAIKPMVIQFTNLTYHSSHSDKYNLNQTFISVVPSLKI